MTALNSSFTTFLKAYKADEDFLQQIFNSDCWVRSSITPDSTYLLNHVYEFFAHNSTIDVVDKNQALIFELRTNFENDAQKESLLPSNAFFNRKHCMKSGDREMNFQLMTGKSIQSPTLIYVPLTGIIMLVLTLRLEDSSQDIDSLIDFNYHLRVSSRGAVTKLSTARKTHPKAQETENKLQSKLEELPEFESDEDSFVWTINSLTSYLVDEFTDCITDLSPARLQAFTYLNLGEDIEEDIFQAAFFRLRRVYSEKYVPSKSFLEGTEETAQTFEKIHYGASVEGAVVLVRNDQGTFLSNYESTVVQRTIWSYLLAFHQRMALISAANETNSLFKNNQEPSTVELSHLIDQLAKLQLKCLFEEISHYSQQNDFYYLALRNLRVENLFREVKEEVSEVNLILTEKWREEEVRDREVKEESQRKNQRKIEVLLALLIIPQIWFAVLSTNVDSWGEFINRYSGIVTTVNVAIWFIIAGGVVRLFLLSNRRKKDH